MKLKVGKFTENFNIDEEGNPSGNIMTEHLDTARYAGAITSRQLTPQKIAYQLEESFRIEFNSSNVAFAQSLGIVMAVGVTMLCTTAALMMEKDWKILTILCLATLTCVLFSTSARYFEGFFKLRVQTILVSTAIFLQLLFEFFLVIARTLGYGFNAIELHMVLIMMVSHAFRVRAVFMYVFNACTILLYITASVVPHYAGLDVDPPDSSTVGGILFVTLCSFSGCVCAYSRELAFRQDFLVRKALLLDNISSRGMLRNMFPKKEHSDKLLAKKIPLEVLENVTLLYSDIKGFTSMVASMEPYLLCTYLDALYSKFDAKLDKYGIYKLDTIGDAFVAIIGVTDEKEGQFQESGSVRMTKFAFDMIADIEDFCEVNNLDIAMRIGIHKGTVVGSVVGKLKPRYLTWGKDCLIGTKLESTGKPNRVHISQAVKEELSLS